LASDGLLLGGGFMLPPLAELVEVSPLVLPVPLDVLPDMPLLVPLLPVGPPVLRDALLVVPEVLRDCWSGPLLHAVNDTANAMMPAVNNNLFVNTLLLLGWWMKKKGALRRRWMSECPRRTRIPASRASAMSNSVFCKRCTGNVQNGEALWHREGGLSKKQAASCFCCRRI
jgi:hypothetical protein